MVSLQILYSHSPECHIFWRKSQALQPRLSDHSVFWQDTHSLIPTSPTHWIIVWLNVCCCKVTSFQLRSSTFTPHLCHNIENHLVSRISSLIQPLHTLIPQQVFSNSLYVQCLAHMVDLALEEFLISLTQLHSLRWSSHLYSRKSVGEKHTLESFLQIIDHLAAC